MFSWLPPYNTTIILLGAGLLGACAGLVGTFAVLRRRALAGDALAHAALPGVCCSFLIFQSRSLPLLLLGALVSGLLGIGVMTGIRKTSRIKEDAAIGLVLSVFYGLGIVLLSYIQTARTNASRAGLSSFLLGETAGMTRQDVAIIGGAATVCLSIVLLLYKEFKLVAFDQGFARSNGWPAFRLDLLLMSLIAMTVIIGLPAAGIVLTAAILIIPAATARFWTRRLSRMLMISSGLGMAIGSGGALLSAYGRLPAGPTIVLVGGGIFLCSVLFAPERGLLARLIRDGRFRRRIADQSVLQSLFEMSDEAPAEPIRTGTIAETHPAATRDWPGTLRRLDRQGYITGSTSVGWTLTKAGRQRGRLLRDAERRLNAFLDQNAELAAEYATFDRASLLDRLPNEG